MMKRKITAAILCAATICTTAISASASQIIEKDGLVYIPDHSIFFVDVAKEHSWALNEIDYLANAEIVSGTEPLFYEPNKPLSRADFIVMLNRAYDMSAYVSDDNFSDIDKSKYYADAVSAAKNLGIVSGDGDNNFYPSDPLTRQDAMVILMRTLEKTGLTLPDDKYPVFDDISDVKSYAKHAVAALSGANIVSGNDGNLNPNDNVTRAQMAVMLYRAMMLKTNPTGESSYNISDNVTNLCVGASFYPNVTIKNAQNSDTYAGLYHCVKLESDGANNYTVTLGDAQQINQEVSYYDDAVYIDGVKTETAETVSSICIDPYSLIDSSPLPTGDVYASAAVSVKDGVITEIYYTK